MAQFEKFSTKVDKKTLARLRSYTSASDKKISLVVSEAIADYLEKVEVRPAFRDAVSEVVKEHRELLKELAK